MKAPRAAYRIQLREGFGLQQTRRLVPYLQALGISHVYLSPVLQARAGSTHGYDVTDPTRLNAELGTEEDLRALAAELRAEGMAILLDIVPNHMAADVQNPWWRDVLEHGPASPYARYFDIDWGAGDGRVLLPVLGRHYGEAIESGELRLAAGPRGLEVVYYAMRLPLDPATWPDVLDRAEEAPEAMQELIARLRGLPPRDEARGGAGERRHEEAQAIERDLRLLQEADPAVRAAVGRALADFDVQQGAAEAARRLDALLARQPYLPSFWRSGSQEINYRRFFDITGLAGVRVEEDEVFDATHRLVMEWLADGTIAGLRVDHVDGLLDPAAYLERLAGAKVAGEPPYVVVEKILAHDERLPADWPVAGTTGYGLLNLVNGLFIEPQGLETLLEDYRRRSGQQTSFGEVVYATKKLVMKRLFGGELHTLVGALVSLARQDLHGRDLAASALGRALGEVTACLPVYRTYACARDGTPRLSPHDEQILRGALAEARRRNPDLDPGTFDFLQRVLLLTPRDETAAGRLDFLMRWQQLTGPVMAKGLEDTALFRWPALLSACEVGSWPPAAAVGLAQFHERMRDTARLRPHTLLTLSTHDTKRSADVRARLDVLSELPGPWCDALTRWTTRNACHGTVLDDGPAPGPLAELTIYQSLLGIWSAAALENGTLSQRLPGVVVKAMREAKVRTGWYEASGVFERAVRAYLDGLLADRVFLEDFGRFARQVELPGMVNGLGQALLGLTLPGVPDVYQGCERWRFSLLDPDNRRPVDFEAAAALLAEVLAAGDDPAELVPLLGRWLAAWPDGRIKLHVTARALRFRRDAASLFAAGDYLPASAEGPLAENVVAFARRQAGRWCLVVVTRWSTRVAPGGGLPLADAWRDTRVVLPRGAPRGWRNVLTGATLAASGRLALREVLSTLPVALLAA